MQRQQERRATGRMPYTQRSAGLTAPNRRDGSCSRNTKVLLDELQKLIILSYKYSFY